MLPLAVADQTNRHAKDVNCHYESDAYARQPWLRQTGRRFRPRGLPLRSAAFRLRKRALALHFTRISNPEGIESSSPGLRPRPFDTRLLLRVGGDQKGRGSYPGWGTRGRANPERVAALSFSALGNSATTLSGLACAGLFPRVARSSLPWPVCRHPCQI